MDIRISNKDTFSKFLTNLKDLETDFRTITLSKTAKILNNILKSEPIEFKFSNGAVSTDYHGFEKMETQEIRYVITSFPNSADVETGCDADYAGYWINLDILMSVSYSEGDITMSFYKNEADLSEFVSGFGELKGFHSEGNTQQYCDFANRYLG